MVYFLDTMCLPLCYLSLAAELRLTPELVLQASPPWISGAVFVTCLFLCDAVFGPIYLDVPLPLHGIVLKWNLASLPWPPFYLFSVSHTPSEDPPVSLNPFCVPPACLPDPSPSTLWAVANAHQLCLGDLSMFAPLWSPGADFHVLSCR